MAKRASLGVRVSEEMKVAIERAAADDFRSVASLVEKVLFEWLRARKYLSEHGTAQPPKALRGRKRPV
jgi:hypothetical protein